MSFSYLLEKIRSATFQTEPFRHLQIDDFFEEEHFEAIVAAPELAVSGRSSDLDLFDELFDRGYKIIDFPGCIIDKNEYVEWHEARRSARRNLHTACEGFGVTLRLMKTESDTAGELKAFLESPEFQSTLLAKFGMAAADVTYDSGIQKYLDGYEISPHPDIRRKALTFMVNINPDRESARSEHHTHYLRFRKERGYVQSYWEGNPDQERCWVPWSWCETVKIQRANNSIVIFAPGNDTMHGVKARYDHLRHQRTQMYGNFWHKQSTVTSGPEWEDLVIAKRGPSLQTQLKAAIPRSVKTFLKNNLTDTTTVIRNRFKVD